MQGIEIAKRLDHAEMLFNRAKDKNSIDEFDDYIKRLNKHINGTQWAKLAGYEPSDGYFGAIEMYGNMMRTKQLIAEKILKIRILEKKGIILPNETIDSEMRKIEGFEDLSKYICYSSMAEKIESILDCETEITFKSLLKAVVVSNMVDYCDKDCDTEATFEYIFEAVSSM